MLDEIRWVMPVPMHGANVLYYKRPSKGSTRSRESDVRGELSFSTFLLLFFSCSVQLLTTDSARTQSWRYANDRPPPAPVAVPMPKPCCVAGRRHVPGSDSPGKECQKIYIIPQDSTLLNQILGPHRCGCTTKKDLYNMMMYDHV